MPVAWPVGLLVLALVAAAGLCLALHRWHLQRARQAQQTLQQVRTELQQRAQKLQAAQRQAEQLVLAQRGLVASASHEMRTPLNSIMGLAQLLLNTQLSARQLDHVRKLERSGRQLQSAINDVLDYTRISCDSLRPESMAFERDALLQEAIALTAPLALDKGLEFVCMPHAQVAARLRGDPLRLCQILVNFLVHAMRRSTGGEVVLRLEPWSLPDPAGGPAREGLRFAVQDFGPALNQIQCAQLFETGLGPQPGADSLSGGGLALPLCARLAALMGGQAGVLSDAGQGTTLWFVACVQRDSEPLVVPIAAPAGAAAIRVDGQAGDPRAGGSAFLRGRRLLLVDDNPLAAHSLAELLRPTGLRVDLSHGGRDGLERLRQAGRDGDPYALVLLDWDMPDWAGAFCAREMAAAAVPPPCMIALSALDPRDFAQAALQAGVQATLRKPPTATALLQALQQATAQGAPPFTQEAPTLPTSAAAWHRLQGAQVLLVEDDEINQEVARELLRVAGVEVDLAGDGQSALEQIARKRYDLVLMDLQMPVLDGLSASRRLRADPRHRDLPIIAMTAHALPSQGWDSQAHGMNACLTKPIVPQQLHAALLRWIRPQPLTEDAYKLLANAYFAIDYAGKMDTTRSSKSGVINTGELR